MAQIRFSVDLKVTKTNTWAPPPYAFTDGLNGKRKERERF